MVPERSMRGFYATRGKRAVDVAVAAVGLILLSPVMLLIALAILLAMGRPILFRHQRPGLHGRLFRIAKFRTMTEARDVDGQLLSDAGRLTRLGSFLRATSLDELPQLWNVLTGAMSLVGPRPLLTEYLPRYSPEQARRHDVRPGITGLAQISGRNDTDWDTRLRLDVEYVDHLSWREDLRIALATIGMVGRREGIAQPGTATMGKFQGTKQP